MTALIHDLWGYAAAALGAVFALGAAYVAGRRDSAEKAATRALRATDKAHERITNAQNDMRGLTDDDVLDGLRDAAKRIGD